MDRHNPLGQWLDFNQRHPSAQPATPSPEPPCPPPAVPLHPPRSRPRGLWRSPHSCHPFIRAFMMEAPWVPGTDPGPGYTTVSLGPCPHPRRGLAARVGHLDTGFLCPGPVAMLCLYSFFPGCRRYYFLVSGLNFVSGLRGDGESVGTESQPAVLPWCQICVFCRGHPPASDRGARLPVCLACSAISKPLLTPGSHPKPHISFCSTHHRKWHRHHSPPPPLPMISGAPSSVLLPARGSPNCSVVLGHHVWPA